MARDISMREFEARFFERVPDIIPGTVSFARAGLLIASDAELQRMMRDVKTASIQVAYDTGGCIAISAHHTGRKAYSKWTPDEVRAKRILDDGHPFPDYGMWSCVLLMFNVLV